MTYKIVSLEDLQSRNGSLDFSHFVPTHHVVIRAGDGSLVREDFVFLDAQGKGLRYAYVPGEEDPVYYVLDTGLWKAFEVHGQVVAGSVRFDPSYKRLSQAQGYVYFIRVGTTGPIKIGWSNDVFKRLSQLQTGNPFNLCLVKYVAGTYKDELALHKKFSRFRISREWFEAASELLEYIDSIEGQTPETPLETT